ncbi:MAG TPA: tRNA-specific 2-thiouridylase [Candidatus Paceibacterota bacterium]|nr:tRNA-specific 2-thiouridylase [Candidatus Paceibacterota bacterium]
MASNRKKTVFVGMSGGVDSSVTAWLLKNRDYDVVGVFMRCYNIDGCAERDAEDARRVAGQIGIPFYVWDFEQEYKDRVVKYMVDGYRAGVTPNPDVMCNREIKFGLFLEKALEAGADFVATGHYVRLFKVAKAEPSQKRDVAAAALAPAATSCLADVAQIAPAPGAESAPQTFALFAADDASKDQSYFLWTLTQEQLQHCIFPIGDYKKPEVREIARKAGLATAEKKDSQGICFLGDVSIADFLKQYIPEKRGALVTTAGEAVGEHYGAEFYTIGQRHINADFKFPKSGARERKPFYVASKDTTSNTVVLAEGDENDALYRDAVRLTQVNFVGSDFAILNEASANAHAETQTQAQAQGVPVMARVRYRQPLTPAVLTRSDDGSYALRFEKPQKFVAEGQSAVFYSKDGEMLGGGVIG